MNISPENQELYDYLKESCFYGNLADVKKVLENQFFKHPDFYHEILFDGCQNGHLRLIQYILTDPIIRDRVNIHRCEDYALKLAIQKKHFEVVQYLLTSPEIKVNANLYAKNNHFLSLACLHNNLPMVKLFMQKYSFKELKTIFGRFKDPNKNETFQYVANYIASKEQKKALNKQVKPQNKSNKPVFKL